MQRMQARDFYIHEFKAKCENKGLDASEFHEKLKQRLPLYKGRWKKSMKGQFHDLPDFKKVERETMRHLRNLEL